VPHRLLSLPDAFVEHGSQAILRAECGIDAASIATACRKAAVKAR
jgi:deoxyxylulose-5-phosphate synthase